MPDDTHTSFRDGPIKYFSESKDSVFGILRRVRHYTEEKIMDSRAFMLINTGFVACSSSPQQSCGEATQYDLRGSQN